MNHLRNTILAVLATLATGAFAQVLPSSASLDLMHRGAFLLADPRVQKTVGLTQLQSESVKLIVVSHSEKQTALLQKNPPSVEAMAAADSAASDALLKTLNDQQRSALRRETFKAAGYSALLEPEIAGELKLSDSQKDKISAILDEAAEPTNNLEEIIGKRINKNPKQSGQILKSYTNEKSRLAKQREEDEAKSLTVLTPKQLEAWKSMTS